MLDNKRNVELTLFEWHQSPFMGHFFGYLVVHFLLEFDVFLEYKGCAIGALVTVFSTRRMHDGNKTS